MIIKKTVRLKFSALDLNLWGHWIAGLNRFSVDLLICIESENLHLMLRLLYTNRSI